MEWNGLDWTRLDWTGLHYIGFYHDTRTEYNGMPCHAVFHGPRQEALRVTVTVTSRHVNRLLSEARRGELDVNYLLTYMLPYFAIIYE